MWFKAYNHKQPSEFPDIVVDDTTLQLSCRKAKYLGVILYNCLLWNHHVSYNMLYYLYAINKHRHVLSFDLMKLLTD